MISVTEIILIIVGFVAVILGFVLPAGKDAAVDPEQVEELVQDKLDRSLNDSVRRQIDGMARDAVADAIDDNKLDLSRISNEKVMEISEYAGTVLDDIKKNHDEVVFMYDMLNDKHKNLTSTVSEMTRTAESAKQTVRDAELTARDAKDAVATLDAATARVKEVAAQERAARERVVRPAVPPAPPTAGLPSSVPSAVAAPETDAAPAGIPAAAPEDSADRGRIGAIFPELAADGDVRVGEATGANALTTVADGDAFGSETDGTASGADVSAAEGAVRTANTPSTAKTAARRAGEPMSQNRQILEMHNAGKSNMVIARELGLGIGEVRLVIDLSKKQGKA